MVDIHGLQSQLRNNALNNGAEMYRMMANMVSQGYDPKTSMSAVSDIYKNMLDTSNKQTMADALQNSLANLPQNMSAQDAYNYGLELAQMYKADPNTFMNAYAPALQQVQVNQGDKIHNGWVNPRTGQEVTGTDYEINLSPAQIAQMALQQQRIAGAGAGGGSRGRQSGNGIDASNIAKNMHEYKKIMDEAENIRQNYGEKVASDFLDQWGPQLSIFAAGAGLPEDKDQNNRDYIKFNGQLPSGVTTEAYNLLRSRGYENGGMNI
jgi:dsDNA-binding SOS-regulon protein